VVLENPADFDPQQRAGYRAFTRIPIRFADQDVLGHVNNAAIAIYFEHARCEHLLPRLAAAEEPNLNIVLARIVIDYVREIRYPGMVDVGVRVTRMGTKSFVISAAAFVGNTCCAIADATIVYFDTQKRCARLPPEAVRNRIAELA
jgi:acyl-CoA thioester hydrolase